MRNSSNEAAEPQDNLLQEAEDAPVTLTACDIGQVAEGCHPGNQEPIFLYEDRWFLLNAQPDTSIFTFFDHQNHPGG